MLTYGCKTGKTSFLLQASPSSSKHLVSSRVQTCSHTDDTSSRIYDLFSLKHMLQFLEYGLETQANRGQMLHKFLRGIWSHPFSVSESQLAIKECLNTWLLRFI